MAIARCGNSMNGNRSANSSPSVSVLTVRIGWSATTVDCFNCAASAAMWGAWSGDSTVASGCVTSNGLVMASAWFKCVAAPISQSTPTAAPIDASCDSLVSGEQAAQPSPSRQIQKKADVSHLWSITGASTWPVVVLIKRWLSGAGVSQCVKSASLASNNVGLSVKERTPVASKCAGCTR